MQPSLHVPFHSIYRENFEVVQERQDRVALFPHTEQLPLLLRALNFEFLGKLPDRVARADHRADGLTKILRYYAATLFCELVNRARADRVRLFALPDAHLVCRVAIVQQITADTARGQVHRFRFYAGADFLPEIRLSGRRLVFADHVLQRFSARVPNNIGEDLTNFLEIFYGQPLISLPCGPGRAFVVPYRGSILAFPYGEEKPGEYIVKTCLTLNEINELTPEMPPCAHNFHYDAAHVPPKLRHWLTPQSFFKIWNIWTRKQPMEPLTAGKQGTKWDTKFTCRLRNFAETQGYVPGAWIAFMDHIPGPNLALFKAGAKEVLADEWHCCTTCDKNHDWTAAFARRDALLRGPHAAAANGAV